METHPAQGDVDRRSSYSDPQRSIPDYLQPFVVEQEPSRYTAIDQAVWRFVLLQLHHRLEHSAHASYARGLAASGISSERIPSILEMNQALGSFGWQAVCVDGFIPPRAFQAFQALGVLPIAAEIRTPEQLPYTPAPDIIHEAAGHAPILIDPRYAGYVRAVGEVGARAFSSPADARVDRAVRLLSDLKQKTGDESADVRAATLELESAVSALGPPSEAARLARLYWWTAEYGLVGTPDDYRLYGAGLLSSLGESHFCHGPGVAKIPLSASCTSVGYDITKPQPQLFVARDFDHLHAVLADVSQTLAYDVGGDCAVRAALESGELCTVHLPAGCQVIGALGAVDGAGAAELLSFQPGAALARRGRLLGRVPHTYWVPLGRLVDGAAAGQSMDSLGRRPDGRVAFRYASGVCVSGVVCDGPHELPETALWLRSFRIEQRDQPPIELPGPYPLLIAERVVTAGAGSACPDVSPLGDVPAQTGPRARVPKLRAAAPATACLNELYELTSRGLERRSLQALATVRGELTVRFPHEWLLRWRLLECLIELGSGDSDAARELEQQLLELEGYYGGKHPIAMGLDYLKAHP